MSLSASVWAQPATPRPHPEPRPASDKIDRTPLPLTPVQTVWNLALNNALAMPPAYDGPMAYFPIDGDRIVAYEILSGAQKWLTKARALSGFESGASAAPFAGDFKPRAAAMANGAVHATGLRST